MKLASFNSAANGSGKSYALGQTDAVVPDRYNPALAGTEGYVYATDSKFTVYAQWSEAEAYIKDGLNINGTKHNNYFNTF